MAAHNRLMGPWDTLRIGLRRILIRMPRDRFDAQHGTQTSPQVSLPSDTAPGPGDVFRSIPYPSKALRSILGQIEIDPEAYRFVDFGCGKGRAILVASELPFAAVDGVEWAAPLAETARRNVETYAPRRRSGPVSVHCGDVLEYEFPGDTDVLLFMYDPFGRETLQAVFERYRRAADEAPERRHRLLFCGLGNHVRPVALEACRRLGYRILRDERGLDSVTCWLLAEVGDDLT